MNILVIRGHARAHYISSAIIMTIVALQNRFARQRVNGLSSYFCIIPKKTERERPSNSKILAGGNDRSLIIKKDDLDGCQNNSQKLSVERLRLGLSSTFDCAESITCPRGFPGVSEQTPLSLLVSFESPIPLEGEKGKFR